MYFILSLFAAIVLAIPTYGASLLVFFLGSVAVSSQPIDL